MEINREKMLASVTPFGQNSSLIRDVLDNLELEQALTWLLEALSAACAAPLPPSPSCRHPARHLYQTTLFSIYVDYESASVCLSAALACHDVDLELPLKEFIGILSREASREVSPRHFSDADARGCIHRYRNPYLKSPKKSREPDPGFYR